MNRNYSYSMDCINKEVSIYYEDEEDLIDCFIDKSVEIAALKSKKLALVEVIYPEVFESYKITLIRPFNTEMSLITVPNEHVNDLKDFYKALDKKCVVSY